MAAKLNQPEYDLIKQDGKIEIRQYSEYVIAKTSIKQAGMGQNNNAFRTLAGIFLEEILTINLSP